MTPIPSSGTTPQGIDEGVLSNSTSTLTSGTSAYSLPGHTDSSSDTYATPYEPPADEAEAYLNTFRSQLLPSLPFIHIASNVTAQHLRQDRPFLFRAIVAVASPSTQQKLVRGRELKRILAQTALLENQSSIDLLLCLLTFVAWSYDQFLNRSGTLSRLMMVAMSIVYDLRLNKPLPPDVHMFGAYTPGFEDPVEDASEKTALRILERQRALLGCFLLSSMYISYPYL